MSEDAYGGPVLVEVRCTPGEVELLTLALFEGGASAVEMLDGAVTLLRVGFATHAVAKRTLEDLAIPGCAITPVGCVGGWDAWKDHWVGTEVGERLHVLPPWSGSGPVPGRLVVVIDPGEDVFGAGTHVSTVLALEGLETCVRGGDLVVDVGTGTGVLAVAAARLGAGHVVALDVDATASRTAKRNVALNGLAGRLDVVNGGPGCLRARPDGVVCNLLLGDHLAVARHVRRMWPRWVVLSGFLEDQADVVCHAWEGYDVRESRCADGWASARLSAP